jgi:hypothetical protein
MHKFPGALCIGKNGKEYLAIYNFQYDIYVKPPNMNGLIYLEHSSYSKGGKKGSIDYYLINTDVNIKEFISQNKIILNQEQVILKNKENKTILLPKENLEQADSQYDIQTQQIFLSEEMQEDLNSFRRADIKNHCQNKLFQKNLDYKLVIYLFY